MGEIPCLKEGNPNRNSLEIESAAGSLGEIDILNKWRGDRANVKGPNIKRKKWTRKKWGRKENTNQPKLAKMDSGKRQLVKMLITKGTLEE